VIAANKEQQDQVDLVEREVHQGQLVHLVQEDLVVHQAQLDLKARGAPQVKVEQMVLLEGMVLLDQQDSEDRLDQVVKLACLVK
jgi:hypothetical protein